MINILEQIGYHPCYIMGDYSLDLKKHDKHLPTEKSSWYYICQICYTYPQWTHKSNYEYLYFNRQYIHK